jgi:hypothetical protein
VTFLISVFILVQLQRAMARVRLAASPWAPGAIRA